MHVGGNVIGENGSEGEVLGLLCMHVLLKYPFDGWRRPLRGNWRNLPLGWTQISHRRVISNGQWLGN